MARKDKYMRRNSMSTESSSGGIGFLGLLTIVFIVLKLTKVISWSWIWVLAPLWIPVLIFLVWIIGYVIYRLIKK